MSTSSERPPTSGEIDLTSLTDVQPYVDAGRTIADAIAGHPDLDALTRLANEFLGSYGTSSTQVTQTAQAVTSATAGAAGLGSTSWIAPVVPAIPGAPLPALATVPAYSELANAASYYFLEASRAVASPAIPGLVSHLTAPVIGPPTSLPGLPAAISGEHGPVLPSGTVGRSREIFDAAGIRRDFPVLQEVVNGRPLVWLDNAATTQKPQAVIDRLSYFYAHENSNVHRAAHALAARSTDAYEAAREQVRRFLNAGSTDEIVFVRGATEGINFVAQSWGRQYIGAGDEIILTQLEHHSNIVPWQMLAAEKGARLRVVPIDDAGQVRLDQYQRLLGPRTRLVALAHVSNALGTVTPVQEMVEQAHRYGARVLVDGAQAVSHMPVDVQALDCDFYVFSGHKVFGPTGIGVVRGKPEAFEESPPWQGGGNMIVDVTFERTVYHRPPGRFEAGTGSIADAVGLGAALAYLEAIGMANVARHEHELLLYGTELLRSVPGLRLIGTAAEKAGVLSFVLEGFRSEDVGTALDREGIAVRAGHHCAQPALRRYGLETTVRPSIAVYNTTADLDVLTTALLALSRGRRVAR